MPQSYLIFDIETGPLPDEQLQSLMPEFNEETVAVGNIKDPEKLAAKFVEARKKWIDKAALSATTGRMLAIGLQRISPDETDPKKQRGEIKPMDCSGNEAEALQNFWALYQKEKQRGTKFVGFNIHEFDLPFMVRRSWILGVDTPAGLLIDGRYWDSTFIDLMKVWGLGDRQTMIGLDTVARTFGIGSKNGSGAEFARLWFSNNEGDRDRAIAYLANDIVLTAAVAERMQVIV